MYNKYFTFYYKWSWRNKIEINWTLKVITNYNGIDCFQLANKVSEAIFLNFEITISGFGDDVTAVPDTIKLAPAYKIQKWNLHCKIKLISNKWLLIFKSTS